LLGETQQSHRKAGKKLLKNQHQSTNID